MIHAECGGQIHIYAQPVRDVETDFEYEGTWGSAVYVCERCCDEVLETETLEEFADPEVIEHYSTLDRDLVYGEAMPKELWEADTEPIPEEVPFEIQVRDDLERAILGVDKEGRPIPEEELHDDGPPLRTMESIRRAAGVTDPASIKASSGVMPKEAAAAMNGGSATEFFQQVEETYPFHVELTFDGARIGYCKDGQAFVIDIDGQAIQVPPTTGVMLALGMIEMESFQYGTAAARALNWPEVVLGEDEDASN